jgi:Protein of unknown function (DUF3352)
MIHTRLLLPVLAAAAALALLAGCGDSGDSASSTDPATIAPPDTPVFIEAKIQPTGEVKTNLEGLARRLAGVEDLGETITSLIEEEAGESEEEIDFEKDIEPWLGESAGLFLTKFDGEDFDGGGFAVEVTDTGEAQDFLDLQTEKEDPKPEDASYEGIDYKIDPDDKQAIGIVGNFIVFGEDKAAFEAAVDASEGDSLADSETYTEVTPEAPENSLADIYVDIGGLIKAAGDEVDPDALKFFESTGVDLERSSAMASLVPNADNVEIDIAGKLSGEAQSAVPGSDAGPLLGSMPAPAIAALSAGDLGDSLGEVIDSIDKEGIPGEVPPNQLKSTLEQAGIDLDQITGNLGDAAVYVQGRDETSLGGALVIEVDDPGEAQKTIDDIGTLLRRNNVSGVTAVKAGDTGFSISSRELGGQPVVVVAKGDRMAIGYGLASTLVGLDAGSATLAKTKSYNEALDALGNTPITGFAAGRPVLRLVEALVTDPEDRAELEELSQYLGKVPYLAIGTETEGDVARARVILGVDE